MWFHLFVIVMTVVISAQLGRILTSIEKLLAQGNESKNQVRLIRERVAPQSSDW